MRSTRDLFRDRQPVNSQLIKNWFLLTWLTKTLVKTQYFSVNTIHVASIFLYFFSNPRSASAELLFSLSSTSLRPCTVTNQPVNHCYPRCSVELDCCNALHQNLSHSQTNRLRHIQNNLTRVGTKAPKFSRRSAVTSLREVDGKQNMMLSVSVQ